MYCCLLMLKPIFAFLLICIHCAVHAQVPANRNIRLTIVDAQKNLIPGTTVHLLNKDSVVIRSEAINASGTIELQNLSAGKYRVRASAAGYVENITPWIDL